MPLSGPSAPVLSKKPQTRNVRDGPGASGETRQENLIFLPRMKTPLRKLRIVGKTPKAGRELPFFAKTVSFSSRRSSNVGSYQNRSASRVRRKGRGSLETALREVTEETGISKFTSSAFSEWPEPHRNRDGFRVYWFLFDSTDSQVEIDWEPISLHGSKPMNSKSELVRFDKLFGQLTRSKENRYFSTSFEPVANRRI